MDEIKLWNYELTENQIEENIYNPVINENLTGYWSFDSGEGELA